MSASEEELERRIRERAYALWEQEGRPDGRAEEFWDRARREIDANAAAAEEETEVQDADADVRDAAE